MNGGRPQIPAQLRRDVLLEAGYRCAMPRCGAETTEIHHIVDYATVKEHTFSNLIALCPNCHARVTKGQIDRPSVKQIKANLSLVSGRYGDLEVRILRNFAENQDDTTISLPGGWDLLVSYLIQDGLLKKAPKGQRIAIGNRSTEFSLSPERYILTEKGQLFIDQWMRADPLP